MSYTTLSLDGLTVLYYVNMICFLFLFFLSDSNQNVDDMAQKRYTRRIIWSCVNLVNSKQSSYITTILNDMSNLQRTAFGYLVDTIILASC